MRVLGIDFTSAPSRRKPLGCVRADFDGELLRVLTVEGWSDFAGFERFLREPGPWIAGIDFPFGQSRKLIQTIGWPLDWLNYVDHVARLGRSGFREALNNYKQFRKNGDKEHRRATDIAAGSISPQKLHGVPVGLMFFEGARRLATSGATILHLHVGSLDRIVVEAYPGVLARRVLGRRSYKHDSKRKQTTDQHAARCELLDKLRDGIAKDLYGFEIDAPDGLSNDPTGDRLDALLCAIQAAWAWKNRSQGYGAPLNVDPLEGWIADPSLSASTGELVGR